MRELSPGWVGISTEEHGEAASGTLRETAGCPGSNTGPHGRKGRNVEMHFTNVSGMNIAEYPMGEKELKRGSVCNPVQCLGRRLK